MSEESNAQEDKDRLISLSEASELYEQSHSLVSNFINADFAEVVFTKNTTESTNTVAYGIQKQLKKGDEIVISRVEHHSNLVHINSDITRKPKLEIITP